MHASDFGPLSTFLFVCGISLLRYPYVAVGGALVSKLPSVLVESSLVSVLERISPCVLH